MVGLADFQVTDEAAYKDGTVPPGYVAAIVMQLQEGLSLQGLKKADDETLDHVRGRIPRRPAGPDQRVRQPR